MLQSTRVEMASRDEDAHIKTKARIYVLFVFDLDGECEFSKNKTLQ